jgi:hypothetical protein
MELTTFLKILGVVALVALAAAGCVLFVAFRQLRRLRVPEGADFFTTLRAVPLSLVVGLDLLDLGLDVFASPVSWWILSRYRLQGLRNFATVEALIPFTQIFPTLTVAWFAARALNLGKPYDPSLIETKQVGPGRYEARPDRR